MATHIHVHLTPKKTVDRKVKDSFEKFDEVEFKYEGRTLRGEVQSFNGSSYKILRRANAVSYIVPASDVLKKTKDASSEDLKRELQRLENRMNAFTKSAPLKEKTETAERIKELRKLLGTKDASSVASVEKDIKNQERLIAIMEKNGKGEQAGPLRSRLKFLQEELEKAKFATGDASLVPEADKQKRIARLAAKFNISPAKAKAALEAEEWDEEEASVNLKAATKDAKFSGAESAWKTKVLNTHPGTFFRPHPVQSNLVRATKDGKSVGFYDTEKREGKIEEVAG